MRSDGERIAILLGIPVTREEFSAKAKDPSWDYGKKLLSGRSADQAFHMFHQPVCSAAVDLLQRDLPERVSVIRSAKLHDLQAVSRTYDVVVLVAHWRDYNVGAHDLRDGWSRCLQRKADDPVIRCVVDMIRRRRIAFSEELEKDARTREDIAGTMTDVIESGKLLPLLADVLGSVTTHELIARTLSRDLLDEAFADALEPGNQLELSDGLHSMAAVRAAIDPQFHGVLDLSCCTSSVLGTSIKLERGDTLQVMMGDHYIIPGPQMRVIEGTLELLGLRPELCYIEAKRIIAAGLDHRYRNEKVDA